NLWGDTREQHHVSYEGVKRLSPTAIEHFLSKIAGQTRGLIVCGPQTDKALVKKVTELAHAWKIPVIADPLSQVRSGAHDKSVIIEGYDALFKNETIREQLKPDYIIRFGAMPIRSEERRVGKGNRCE